MIKKHWKTSHLLLSSLAIILPASSIISCSNTGSNLEAEIINAFNDLITSQSAKNIDELLFNKKNNEITYQDIVDMVELNENNLLNKELIKVNKFEDYKKSVAESILISYQNEQEHFESEENNSKHGSIFRKHFWDAIGHQMISSYLIIYATIFWWSVQIGPAILSFVTTLDGSMFAEALASFNFNVPSFFVDLAQTSIRKVKKFKQNTKCKWKFVIWNSGGYLVTI